MLLFLAQKTKIVVVFFFLGTNFMILVKMKISA